MSHMNQQSPRLREVFHLPNPTPMRVESISLLCLSRDQVTGYAAIWQRVTVPLFFPTSPLHENTRLGTCCDWKPSTWSSLWGSDPALCWKPWLKSKKAFILSARLRVFRTLQEMNSCPHESPAKQKGEKDPQDIRTDQSFFRRSPQLGKYRL